MIDPQTPDPVESALQSWPLAETPPGLSAAVMRRVRRLAPAPRFRLAWLDYALAVFLAGMVAAAYLVWRLIPAANAQMAEQRLLTLAPQVDPAILTVAVFGGLGLLVVLIAGTALLLGGLAPRPRL